MGGGKRKGDLGPGNCKREGGNLGLLDSSSSSFFLNKLCSFFVLLNRLLMLYFLKNNVKYLAFYIDFYNGLIDIIVNFI